MDFKFPDVGEGITEGKLVAWKVNVGDSIKSEQTVASIETDKAIVDIPSPVRGIVESLPYKVGDVIFVGKTLMTINEGGSSGVNSNNIPRQEKIEESRIEKKIESRIYAAEPSRQAIQQSNNFSYNSANDGKILAMPAVRKAARIKGINLSTVRGSGSHGQIVLSDIGVKLSDITGVQTAEYRYTPAQQIKQSAPAASPAVSSTFNNKSYSDILATLATKQLSRELGVDLTQVRGTGNNGMITADDVRNAAKAVQPSAGSSAIKPEVITAASIQIARPVSYGDGTSTNVPFNSIRNAIYKHMTETHSIVPHFTITDEVDVTELYSFREKYKEHYEKQGVKLTYLPFIIRAVVDALIKHPYINSSVNDTAKEMILKKYYNIGIATDTPEGLVVPVVKDADKKNILQTAGEIAALSGKARERKLSLDDMRNGTFTITSLGNSFGQAFTPIINHPETAILGVGRIVEKPVILNGNIVPRRLMTLSLSCDHRIIDGAEASRFMNDVKWNIENFETLLLN
ncbi:MAG TPA: 2-oxo acid dehydrogenase subunit E2 [Alphaproteobacteria bacterium]|nr:2-oxo acid dehydrogenase subunit E2 [Alphaproteobacteria bacterium]